MYHGTAWPETATARVHRDQVYHLAWSGDGILLASGGADARVQVLDADLAVRASFAGHTGFIMEMGWTTKGRLVTSSQDGAGRVWSLTSPRAQAVLVGHANLVPAMAVRRDGEVIVTGGDDRTVRVWDPDSGREIGRLLGHTQLVLSVGFVDDATGTTLFSAGGDGTLLWWRLASPPITAP
jgi:WD40 repeat protein